MSSIRMEHVSHSYGEHTVLHDFSMEIQDGEFISVIGGSGSGKSAYAEKRLLAMEAEKKHYIATMRVFDEEGKKRVEKHRTMRREKGFLTIEKPIDLGEIALDAGDAWMLECVSNLLANEMFTEDGIRDEKETVDKILKDIGSLIEQTADGVIVSNNIFEDGENYDDAMASYIKALGGINQALAAMVDEVIEVVVGIPVTLKSQHEESEGGQICEK